MVEWNGVERRGRKEGEGREGEGKGRDGSQENNDSRGKFSLR